MKFYRLVSRHSLSALLVTLLFTLFTSSSYASALYVPETANPTDTAFAVLPLIRIPGTRSPALTAVPPGSSLLGRLPIYILFRTN